MQENALGTKSIPTLFWQYSIPTVAAMLFLGVNTIVDGLFVGRYTLPDMLYNMEAQHYILPTKLRPPISETEWGMTALMVLLSVFICLYAYQKSAREEAAKDAFSISDV